MRKRMIVVFLLCFIFGANFQSALASADVTYRQGVEHSEVYTVTFNPVGGTVDRTSKSVANGSEYGDLPVPTRNNYMFDGWFTFDGKWITSTTKVELTSDQTLYAHWTNMPATCTVTFDPGKGGKVEPASKTVTCGRTYGELPTPVLANNYFVGWFTKPDNSSYRGDPVISTTEVTATSNHTLYAHWTRVAIRNGEYRVTFNANGGSVTTEAIAVANGQPYGELPVPVREGWTFVGWFTEQGDDKGNLVTSATVAELLTNQTLYAHWSEIKTLVSLSDLAYSFPNSREGFGYDADYRIDYGQYAIIFGDTPAAKSNYEADETWGGNCYGISVTAGMFCQAGNEISVGDFKIGASVPSELKLDNTNSRSGWNNMSLQAFIETMQVSQKNSSVQNSIHKNKNRYDFPLKGKI